MEGRGRSPIARKVRVLERPPGRSLAELVEAFLVGKKVSGISSNTSTSYRMWLDEFVGEVKNPNPLAVQRFISGLRERGLKEGSVHKAFSVVRTFLRWCVSIGALGDDPLRGFSMRLARTLPRVPTGEDLVALLAACPDTIEGVRNRAVILTLADSGLRASELLRLLVEDWRPEERGLFVRSGKGRKDRVVFIGPTTTRALKAWLGRHPAPSAESFLFADRRARPLNRRHLITILHRLSEKAGLRVRVHPHSLRHFAATAWLRGGAGLDEVRRLLGHESLAMTLRYSSLAGVDLQRAHRAAGAIERLGLR